MCKVRRESTVAVEYREKSVEIRLKEFVVSDDEVTGVVLFIKRRCSISGEIKEGEVSLDLDHTLRLYLEE